jgi:MFS family permease
MQTNVSEIGHRNIKAMYGFTLTSSLWFDGGLWLIYFQHKGVSLFDVGVLEALLHIVVLVFDVPIGLFADRFGWKRSLALGSLLGMVYTLSALFGTNMWWYGIAFAARGLQVTLTSGSDSSILYESAIWAGWKERYLQLSGRVFAIALVSMGLAEAVGGTLAHLSWSLLYVAFTLANVVSFLILILFVREPRSQRHSDTSDTHETVVSIAKDALKFARSCPHYLHWLSMSAILSGFVATFGFYGQSLLRHNGWSLIGIGVLMGAENGIGAIAAMLADRFVRAFGERFVISLANGVASVGLLLFSFLPGLFSAIGYLLNSTAVNMADPVINQGLNRLVPSEQRATLMSAHSTSFSVFMVVVFPIFGAVADHIGLTHTAWLFAILGALSVSASLLWWRFGLRPGAEVTEIHVGRNE